MTGRNNYRFFRSAAGRLALAATVFCLIANLVAPRCDATAKIRAAVGCESQAAWSLRQACAKAEAVDPRTEVDPVDLSVACSVQAFSPPLRPRKPRAFTASICLPRAELLGRVHGPQGPPLS